MKQMSNVKVRFNG